MKMLTMMTRRRVRCVMAALLLSVLAGGADAQRPNERVQVGRWIVANIGGLGGNSDFCLATTTFNDNGVIGILTEGSFAALYIAHPGVRTTPNTRYDVAYSFDGGRWTRASGEGGRDDIMTIRMSGSVENALRDFADMDEVDVQLPNNVTASRSLSGSGAAIAALRRCLRN